MNELFANHSPFMKYSFSLSQIFQKTALKVIEQSYPISASPSDSLVPGSNDPFVALTDKLKQIKKIIVRLR